MFGTMLIALALACLTAAGTPRPDSVRVPILVYHSVMPHHPGQTKEQRILDVDTSNFGQQMRFLVNGGYHVVSFQQLVDALDGRDTLPARAVVITFDDGWQNQYKYAFPVLRKLGMPATFFVFTSVIDHDKRNMTWDELRQMQAAGMTIGSHTRTHPILPDDHRGLAYEVDSSRVDIQRHLGTAPKFFAYPFGAWDRRALSEARHAGYDAARLYGGGTWNDRSRLFALHAVPVTDNMERFERAVTGDSVATPRGRAVASAHEERRERAANRPGASTAQR